MPNGGPYAVVFFFMLSGLSLSIGYGNRIESLNNYNQFYKKRLVQLYPMQILTLFLRAIPFLFIPLLIGKIDLEKIASFILKMFFLEAWIPNKEIIFDYNSCAWYLSPLVFCYMLFPYLFKLIGKVNISQISIAIISYLMIYVFSIHVIPEEHHQEFLYVAPYYRIFDFVIGILLFRFFYCSRRNYLIVTKICSIGGVRLL